MDLKTGLFAVVLCGAAWNAWQLWEYRAVNPADGVIAPDDPIQTEIDNATPVHHGRWTLKPRARYDLTARVLGREEYHFDSLADLVPEDLAIGWGAMSDNRVLAEFELSQAARFFTWRPKRQPPIRLEEVISHSANTHVIPLDSHVGAQLGKLRKGQLVHLRGLLVDAVRDDGAWIQTSLSRTDTGAGACEVMLVETVDVQ